MKARKAVRRSLLDPAQRAKAAMLAMFALAAVVSALVAYSATR